MENKLSTDKIADVMRAHKEEIMSWARCPGAARGGFRVMVEVENDGTWRGAGIVSPGTGSVLAHENQGFVCFFSCSSFLRYCDIEEEILQWLEQMDAEQA